MLSKPEVSFKGVSVDQCASKCLTEATIDCQSFDYCFETGSCMLSHVHTDQTIKVVPTHLTCDLYSSKFDINTYCTHTFIYCDILGHRHMYKNNYIYMYTCIHCTCIYSVVHRFDCN